MNRTEPTSFCKNVSSHLSSQGSNLTICVSIYIPLSQLCFVQNHPTPVISLFKHRRLVSHHSNDLGLSKMFLLQPPPQKLGKRASDEDIGLSRLSDVKAARKEKDHKEQDWVHRKPRMRLRLFCCNCKALSACKTRSACADCSHIRQQCLECLNGQLQHLEVKANKVQKKETHMRDGQLTVQVLLICAWIATANGDKTVAINEGES